MESLSLKLWAKVFRQKIEVGIGHIKKVTPREVANDKPDLIIVGTPVRAFSTSFASKMWIRGLKKQLRKVNHVIPLGMVYLTHVMPKKMVEFWGKRFHKILDRGYCNCRSLSRMAIRTELKIHKDP